MLDNNVNVSTKNLSIGSDALENDLINIYLYELDLRKWEIALLNRLDAKYEYQQLIDRLSFEIPLNIN